MRIAGSETQDSFVGSDFTYEDIGGREFEDYTYAFAGADGEKRRGRAGRRGTSGVAPRVEAQGRLRAVPARRLPRPQGQLRRGRADIFNRRNERQKVYTVRRSSNREHLDGDGLGDGERLEKSRTELAVERADYNVGLKEADFSRRELSAVPDVPGGTP